MWFVPIVLLMIGVLWIAVRKGFGKGVSPGIFLFITFLVLLLLLITYFRRPDAPTGREGQAIDLSGTFQTLDGKKVTLDQYQGKVLFLNVWATWCPPCRAEMPTMSKLYERLSKDGLSMVAISNEDAQTVRQFMSERHYPFTVLLDPNDILGRRFGINSIPTTFVVDGQGRLVMQHVGYNDWDSPKLRYQFEQMLKQ